MDERMMCNPSPPPFPESEQPQVTVKEENEYDSAGECSSIGTDIKKEYEEDMFAENAYVNSETWGACENEYYCTTCKSSMNSELTWYTHLNGKRHKRKLAAATYTAPDMIKMEVQPNTNIQHIKIAGAPLLVKTQPMKARPRIQHRIDDCQLPIIGLNFVTEIQMSDDSQEPLYHCALCPADCQVMTIINHVIGYKHRISYMKLIDPTTHKVFSNSNEKKSILSDRVERWAAKQEMIDGRGHMLVEMEIESGNELTEAADMLPCDKIAPQLPPSALNRLLEQTENLSGAKYFQTIQELTTDLATKCDSTCEEMVEKCHTALIEYYYKSVMQIYEHDKAKREKMKQNLKEKNFYAILQDIFHMGIGSVGHITKPVMLQLIKEGVYVPHRRT